MMRALRKNMVISSQMFGSDLIQLNWQRHHSTKLSRSGMLLMYNNNVSLLFVAIFRVQL